MLSVEFVFLSVIIDRNFALESLLPGLVSCVRGRPKHERRVECVGLRCTYRAFPLSDCDVAAALTLLQSARKRPLNNVSGV